MRLVLQPGGEVHRDTRWSGTRVRWSAPKDGGGCERSPAGVVPAGEYRSARSRTCATTERPKLRSTCPPSRRSSSCCPEPRALPV
jgi:hypothetical protein